MPRGSIGPLNVEVHGADGFARQVVRELGAPLAEPQAPDPDIIIVSGRFDPHALGQRPTIFSAKNHVWFNRTALFADEPVRFLADQIFVPDRPAVLHIDGASEPLFASLRRRLGRTIDAHPALTYALLWSIVHVRLLHRRASFAHAAFFERNSTAVGIGGTGGSGKTTLLFHALKNDDVRYLAEDFGILAADGTVWPSPKAVSLYSSDLGAENVDLQGYVRRLPLRFRVKWLVHDRLLRTTPMVKAPLVELLGAQRVAPAVPLGLFVYLRRADGDAYELREADAAELGVRLGHVTWREAKRLLELLRLVHANAEQDALFDPIEKLIERTAEALTAGLSRADTYLFTVPARARPIEIIDRLQAEGVTVA